MDAATATAIFSTPGCETLSGTGDILVLRRDPKPGLQACRSCEPTTTPDASGLRGAPTRGHGVITSWSHQHRQSHQLHHHHKRGDVEGFSMIAKGFVPTLGIKPFAIMEKQAMKT